MTWIVTGGSVADHIVDVKDEVGNRAKFKQPRDQGPRKLIEISNELIVHDLARSMTLTTAHTCYGQIGGKPGIISTYESNLNWSHITTARLQSSVVNLDQVRQLLAFDIWIANADRPAGKGDHLVVKQIGDVYLAYPIDASHTLNGYSGEMWPDGNVEITSRFPVEAYSHISEGEIQSYSQLEPMVNKIQMIRETAVSTIVDSVTTQVSSDRPLEENEILRKNSEIVKRLLSFRRNMLASTIRLWCHAKGKTDDFQEPGGHV